MRKKNEERLGRKKQKIAALSQIMNINKSDRLETNGKRKNEDADSGASKKVRGDEEGSASDTVALSDDQYKQIKREIAQKTNELKSIPNFRLRFFGEKADFNLGNFLMLIFIAFLILLFFRSKQETTSSP